MKNHKKNIIIFFIFIYIIFKNINKNLIILKNNEEDLNINKKNFDLKVCLCVICKEENAYIKDFIKTYRELGFDHIFIYDNNDINGENLENVVIKNIKEGFVTIINYRGYRGYNKGPQMDAYYNCYERNNFFYNWIAFFDVDEYLILNECKNIKEFLMNSRYKKCEIIKINWKIFTDNNKIDYEDKPLKQRFTEPANIELKINTVYKVIIRGNISNISSKKLYNPHDIFKSNKSCDSNGNIRFENHINPPEYKYAILNHYKKTIREFCKKIKKGDVYFKINFDKKFIKYHFNDFFQYNKKTKEKIEIFNKEFNITLK